MELTKWILLMGVLCMAMIFGTACGQTESADSSLPTTTTTVPKTTTTTSVVTDDFSFIAIVTEVGRIGCWCSDRKAVR